MRPTCRWQRRGGGAFDFGLTTGASPAYDEDYAVIGRVLDAESMAALAELDALPVVKAAEVLGVEASKASREKACTYGSSNSYCNQNKPLKKVTLLRSAVL